MLKAYVIFSGQLVNSFIPEISQTEFAVGMATAQALILWLKSVKFFAFTSIIGDAALMLGMNAFQFQLLTTFLLGVTVVVVYGFKNG